MDLNNLNTSILARFRGLFYGQFSREVFMMTEKENVIRDGSIVAENRARAREREAQPNDEVILAEFKKAVQQAQKKGERLLKMTLENEKEHHVYVEFTQKLRANIQYLSSIGYFTRDQQAMLWSLEVCIAPHSNFILVPEHACKNRIIKTQKTKTYATVADIARYVKMDRADCSRIIKELTRKGAIYQVLTLRSFEQQTKTGHICSPRILIANPELIYAGYQDEVNAFLCDLLREDDIIEKAGHKLPFKLWWDQKQRYGELISRETWLRKKRTLLEKKG